MPLAKAIRLGTRGKPEESRKAVLKAAVHEFAREGVSGARTDSYDRVAGLAVGADHYLAKPFAPDELLISVRRLVRRSAPLSAASASGLTKREREVLALMAEGLAPREIATRLVLSPKTVATHIGHVLEKLGVHSQAQAVAVAYRGDLVNGHS